MILSFDTSLPVLSVALVEDGVPLGSLIVESAGSRNEKLLPAVDWLLAEVSRPLDAVTRIVVTRGPGSFTGVRIGLATAQGLAFSRGLELVALSTHEAVAPDHGRVVVVGDAGRGEVYRTRFENGRATEEPDLARREETEGPDTIDVVELCRVQNVALMAALKVHRWAGADRQPSWADATPIYVRQSAAEEKLKRAESGE